MNTCRQTPELQRYHDGELSAQETARMDQHIASCQACQEELASLEHLSAMLTGGRLPALRPLALQQLHQQLDHHMDTQIDQQAQRGTLRLAEWLTAAAAVILLVSSMQLFFMQSTPSTDAGPMLAWEMTSAMLSQETAAGDVITSEHTLAAWMVSDLSASSSQGQARE